MRRWPVMLLLWGVSATWGASDLLVSPAWLAEHLNDPHVAIVQLSDSQETFAAAHLPGARCLLRSAVAVERGGVAAELPPLEQMVATFTALGIGDTAKVVLYDDEGKFWAARGFVALDYLGHGERCALLDGGLPAWVEANQPLTRDVASYQSAPFTPHYRPEVIVPLQQVIDASWLAAQPQPAACLLDVRSTAEYTGETPGPEVLRGGHIPGAKSLPLSELCIDLEVPKLKPTAELRELFAQAGARLDRPVVIYCRTGVRGSMGYFVAKLLGHDARLYDGSFLEWSRHPQLPVATGE